MPKGKATRLLINVAQQAVHKTADILDRLAVDPPDSLPSSSSAHYSISHAPPPTSYIYPPDAPQAPPFYPPGAAPPPPPLMYPQGAPTPQPPPPPEPQFASHQNSSYSAVPSYPIQSYPGQPPSYVPGPSASAPSLHPPGFKPSPTPLSQPSHTQGASTSAPNLYPPPPSYSEASPPFSPSAPPQTPPPGYPQPPQELPPKYYNQSAHNSSSATCSELKTSPQGASHFQPPYASAPDLPSPADDLYHPANHIPHSQSSPTVPKYYRPPEIYASSRPASGDDIVQGRPSTFSVPASQPAPKAYPSPPQETDSESYHTASGPPPSPFVLPSATAGTPEYPTFSPFGPHPATNSASENITPPSPSLASTQMSCAAFNIIPVRMERLSERPELIMDELLEEVHKRQVKVADSLGKLVLDEACKGLSRVLNPADDTDIQLFAIQLRRADYAACEQDYHRCTRDNIPIFAVSYAHHDRGVGRYKFSDDQWENFEMAMRLLAKCNIRLVRIWLDQCLWLRDSNLGCWAHTGMIPYVMWPVFSLGVKAPERDRTFDSFYRVWPYIEEIAGLWSMGVITTSELHQEGEHDIGAPITKIRYNHRVSLEPQTTLYLLFHAILDGKIAELDYTCKGDVHELTDIAMFNMGHELDHVVVGSNWRARISPLQRKSRARRFTNVRSASAKGEFITAFSSGTVYLDM